MRLHLGSVPDDFSPDGSWRAIREPAVGRLHVLALPIGFGAALLTWYCWRLVGGLGSFQFHGGLGLLGMVLSLPVLIVVHELLHALVHPQFGCSRSTVLGVWPSRLICYAHYSGPLDRDRLLLVLAMPFFVVTVVPLALAGTAGLPPGLTMWAAWFSTWNALCACGDYVGVALIWYQVPPTATVQNRGWWTHWRAGDDHAA